MNAHICWSVRRVQLYFLRCVRRLDLMDRQAEKSIESSGLITEAAHCWRACVGVGLCFAVRITPRPCLPEEIQ